MPAVELIPIRKNQLHVLRNLYQLYCYDFSEYFADDDPEQINEDGLFEDRNLDLRRFAGHPGYWGYLGRMDGRLAGFALVSDQVHRRNGPGRYVNEFFVLRRYRRRGVGRAMAHLMFDTFRGYWEVTEIAANIPAQMFWRRVIDEYTGGHFEEFTTFEEGLQIIWQVFDTSR